MGLPSQKCLLVLALNQLFGLQGQPGVECIIVIQLQGDQGMSDHLKGLPVKEGTHWMNPHQSQIAPIQD